TASRRGRGCERGRPPPRGSRETHGCPASRENKPKTGGFMSRNTNVSRRSALKAAAALAVLPFPAFAAFPEKAVRLIVPFPPRGKADIQGRLIAEGMSQALGHPVVVENKGGAGGSLGAAEVARAAPDGYTVLIGSNGPLCVNPFVQARPGYD